MVDPLQKLPLSLLVLEGQAIILLDIESTFVAAGYAVAIASTAEAALALLGERQFDVAILDFHLGTATRPSVATALLMRKIPFVFCTARTIEAIEGYVHVPVLGKPFVSEDLIAAVAQVLQSR